MRRIVPTTVLFALSMLPLPVAAEIEGFPEVVLFAKSSMEIGASAQIVSGDVVVNQDVAGTLSFGNKASTPSGWRVLANSIDVGTNVKLDGTEFCNAGELFPCDGGGLDLPVFHQLPVFHDAVLDLLSNNVDVAAGETAIVAGDAMDITIALEGTVVFTPGVHNVRSITADNKADLVFSGPTEIRVAEGISMGLEANINLSGAAADEVVFYVGGAAGASLGSKSEVNANFFVDSGTLEIPGNVTATGAFLAHDLVVGTKAKVTLASIFFNRPPEAVADSALTDEDQPVTIDVLANDSAGPVFEAQELTLDDAFGAENGHAKIVGDQVEYTPDANFNGTASFSYTICDGGCDEDTSTDDDDLCATATVTITVTPVNDAPIAFAQDVFTNGDATLAITLTATDIDGDVLAFSLAGAAPTKGTLNPPMVFGSSTASVTVDYTPTSANNLEDTFSFQVDDGNGGIATAIVGINPGGDANQPPDDPTAEVVANDQRCELEVLDPGPPVVLGDDYLCDLEAIEASPLTIILTGAAPCEEVNPPEAEPCDGNGNDVPLFFSAPLVTSQNGTLTAVTQGTGDLQEPPGPNEVPQRTAYLVYTPPDDFTGVDSFDFTVEGDVDGSGTIDPGPEPGNLEVDAGTIQIFVAAFTPPADVVARDQVLTTTEETPIEINLSGLGERCSENDPDCRPDPQAPATSSAVSTPSTPGPGRRMTPSSGGVPTVGGVAAPGYEPSGRVSTRAPRRPVTQAVTPPPAGATVIDFDDLMAPLLFIDTTRLTDEYAAQGVVFSGPGGADGGAVLDSLTFFCPGPTTPCPVEDYFSSPPNVLAFNDGAVMSDGGIPRGPETLTFTSPVANVQINAGCGDFVPASPGADFGLECFDAQGVSLGADAIDDAASCLELETLAVSAAGISSCQLTFNAVVASGPLAGSNVAVFDDLAYVRGPDLTVTLGVVPANPAAGDDVELTATVANVGGEPAAASRLLFEIRSQTTENEVPDGFDPYFDVPPLGPGQTFAVKRVQALDPDTYDVTAIADADAEIAEASETNNQATVEVTVAQAVEQTVVGYAITVLPQFGSLSYVNPFVPDTTVTVTQAGPVPTETVTYTPFEETVSGVTDTFEFSVTNAFSSDLGVVSILVEGLLSVLPDECVAVGRLPGCSPGAGSGAVVAEPSDEGFAGPRQGLTITVEGRGGSVSTGPVELPGRRAAVRLICGEAECHKALPAGARVTLYARPDGEHFEFLGWGGDCRGSEPILEISLRAATHCTASFGPKPVE